MTYHSPLCVQNFMYNANISFPVRTVIGMKQTGSNNLEKYGLHLLDVLSLNTYL